MDLASRWSLDPDITFLNHGSFGACPREVLAVQAGLRDRLEAEPVRFLGRELDDLLAGARASLGRFVGADPDDLAFVPNATAGVNTVLRSLRFGPGDELLTLDHEYNAFGGFPVPAAREPSGTPVRRVVRISAAPYNRPDQYERLADALLAELEVEATLRRWDGR